MPFCAELKATETINGTIVLRFSNMRISMETIDSVNRDNEHMRDVLRQADNVYVN